MVVAAVLMELLVMVLSLMICDEVLCCWWLTTVVCSVWTELLETRTARPFSFSFNTSDYRILHMDQDQGRLYLGCREYLVALDMHNVNKEPLIVRLAPLRTALT